MAKIVLNDTSSGSTFVINENFRKIEEVLNDKVLYRLNPPANPNQMENALDMNSNDIINAGVVRAKRVEAEESSEGGIPIAGEVDNNELIKWDKLQARFVGSGLTSEKDGELTTASNSVNIGVHDIGSGGRNVVAINRVDNRVFDFITQEVGLEEERNTNAFVRERSNVEDIAFNSDSNAVITDPSWTINAVSDQTVLGSSWWPAIDMDDVIYEIVEDGEVVYSENLGSFTADDLDFRLASTPYDLYQGQQYISRLRCADGSLCRFRGSADGTPWYTIKLRPFTNKELATKEYVDLNTGAEKLDDLSDVGITSPQQGDRLLYSGSQWVNEALLLDTNVYAIVGINPIGVLEDFVSNYVYVKSEDSNLSADMPQASSNNFLYLVNENTVGDITFQLRANTTLDDADADLVVPPKHRRLVVYEPATNNWATVFNEPLITSQSTEIPKGDILRVLYRTGDTNEATQPIAVADTPQVVTFTEVTKESNFVEVDPATGVFTFLNTEPAIVSVEFQVRRDGGAGQDSHWGVFSEISIDGGQAWQVFPFSTVRETFSSAEDGEVHLVSYSVPVIPEGAGMQVRFKQYSDSTNVAIVSQPANADGAQEPDSAGAMFSVYTVQ